MSLPKLVRDKIPDLIRERGAVPQVRLLAKGEFFVALLEKLSEEAAEFEANPSLEELADLSEVLHGLALSLGMSYVEVERSRKKKFETKGGFERGILLERIDEPG